MLGFAFAAGWSPCIGPILASILLFAGREGNILRATALLFSYSLGFALPFLATGLFFDRMKPLLSFFSKHGKAVRVVSGIVLVIFGIAMAAGSLGALSSIASKAGYSLQAYIEKHAESARFIGAGMWAAIGIAFTLPAAKRKQRKTLSRRYIALIGGGLAAVLAVAELLGGFSTLSLIAGWLTFAGI